LRATGLKTQLKLLPLLICCFAEPLLAADLPPFAVSPELIRGSAARRSRPAVPREQARETEMTETRVEEVVAPESAPVPERIVSPLSPVVEDDSVASSPLAGEPAVEDEGVLEVAVPLPEDGELAVTDDGEELVAVEAPAAREKPVLRPGGTEITADYISGTQSVELVAEDNAELRRDGMIVTGDRLSYNELSDIAQADGNVHVTRGTDKIEGPHVWMQLNEQIGEFETPVYQMTRLSRPMEEGEVPVEVTGRGHADKLHFEGENQYRFDNATWTTCEAPKPDWYIKAGELELDYDTEVGVAHKSSLVFKDVPILWWPKMSFPLVAQRQSGFLVPTMGMSNKTGLDVSIPYYWNIAPNYDATIAPRYMGRRGLQLAGEARYLTAYNQGQIRGEWLPRDSVTGESRDLLSWQHFQTITPRLSATIDYNAVSDDEYFEDLSSRVSVASRVNLLRQGRLNYSGDWWGASAMVESYQNLWSGGVPYKRLPQLYWYGHRENMPFGTVFSMDSEYVKFAHEDRIQAEGTRFMMHPSLSWPLVRPGYFFTPKVSVHYTKYDLDRTLPGGRDSISRTVPIASVDTGLFFERDAAFFGQAYQQTLEPRLLYVYAPYRYQQDIPLFDTARYDFGFAQIFTENNYTGEDRISDANQVTAAITSRLINPLTGAERMRFTVGQRFYFSNQRVTMNELGRWQVEPERERSRTDWLAGFQGRVTQNVYMDSLWQFNPDDDQTERFNVSMRYRPEFGKAFNISYRYFRDILRDVDISSQWPLTRNLYGVARLTRSLKDGRFTEALTGLEYRGGCGCWVARVAAHRFATNEDDTTQALYFQLELSGLGGIGPSPLKLLRRSVPGYGRINEPVENRYFYGD